MKMEKLELSDITEKKNSPDDAALSREDPAVAPEEREQQQCRGGVIAVQLLGSVNTTHMPLSLEQSAARVQSRPSGQSKEDWDELPVAEALEERMAEMLEERMDEILDERIDEDAEERGKEMLEERLADILDVELPSVQVVSHPTATSHSLVPLCGTMTHTAPRHSVCSPQPTTTEHASDPGPGTVGPRRRLNQAGAGGPWPESCPIPHGPSSPMGRTRTASLAPQQEEPRRCVRSH